MLQILRNTSQLRRQLFIENGGWIKCFAIALCVYEA